MGGPFPESLAPSHELNPSEVTLIEIISKWPEVVERAAQGHKTLEITNYAYEAARAFNDFYNQCPVLKAEPAVRDFRIRLVAATRQTIANSLRVLNIPIPEVM